MPDALSNSQTLQARYEAKVAADLQHNAEDRERATTQLATLQEQLEVLRRDREMLLTMQQAVTAKSVPSASQHPAPSSASGAQTAAPEAEESESAAHGESAAKATTAKATTAKRGNASKERAPSRGRISAGTTKNAESGAAASQGPTLVELVQDHLVKQGEPMSAAEAAVVVSTAERPVTLASVRTALEGLVRKSAAHRSKQGRSVYYEHVPAGVAAPPSTGDVREQAEPSSEETAGPSGENTGTPAGVPGREPLSAEQVLAILRELGGAHTARDVAQRLYTETPDRATVNRVRTGLTRLVTKGAAAKSTQDGTVLFEAKP